MLSAGFAEATLKDMAGEFPEEETPYVDFYDYGSDSDLDDFEDEQDTADERVSDIDGECTTPTVKRPATLVRSGPVVIIKDAAFLTLVYWLFRSKTVLNVWNIVSGQSWSFSTPERYILDKNLLRSSYLGLIGTRFLDLQPNQFTV